MDDNDKKLYGYLNRDISSLLLHKEKLGVMGLPTEFSGVISDILYDEGTHNPALVLFINALAQEVKGKSEQEIVERFELIRKALRTVLENVKASEEQ